MARRRPAPPSARDGACPCGLGPAWEACCGRFVDGGSAAPTAELLMRSRYSAYVVGDPAHLLRTWHSTTRPAVLDLGPDPGWRRLEVVDGTGGGLLHAQGTVRFRAHHRTGVLEEDSAFAREQGRWVYVGPVA